MTPMHRTYQVVLSSIVAVVGFAFALPTHAAGNYYAFAGDPASDDTNSCRTVDDPCATLNGTLDKILENVDPSNATIYADGTFVESVSVNDAELNGLTMTWYDEGSRPVVDGTGNSQAVTVAGPITDFTLRHFDITGAQYYGVYAYGNSNTHNQRLTFSDLIIHDFDQTVSSHYGMYITTSDNVTINNVTVESLGSDTADIFTSVSAYGIYVYQADHMTILNSTVRDLTASSTSLAGTSMYVTLYGIGVQEADDLTIKNNEVYNLVSVTETNADSAYGYNYLYGIYLYNNMDSTVRGNSVHDMTIENTANGDASYGYGYIYGVYAGVQNRTVVRNNDVSNLSSTFTVQDTESATPYIYGIGVAGIEENIVRANTISELHATSANGNGSPQVVGIDVSDVAKATVRHNTVKDTSAAAALSGGVNRGVRLTDSPKTNMYHNRIADFVASGAGSTQSTGVEIGYNSEVDLFNNVIYFTESTDQTNADGILLLSNQSAPVRMYHNTISGMLTCLDMDNWNTTKFMNNLCYMTDGGAYGIEVTSELRDLSLLQSNNNAFYNASGALSFNDTTEGVLAIADWRSGIYDQDEKSTTKNPHLNLMNPDGAKYLHLTQESKVKNAGRKNVSFGSDDAMNTRLQKDWDGQKRFGAKNPDPGFDEYRQ